MKRKSYLKMTFIVFFCICTFSISTLGQTIKTPKNQTVYVISDWDTAPLISKWESDASGWINDHNSDATRISAATSNYNCHSYAWHVVDGGSSTDTWMNPTYLGGSNLAKYWTNDAYSSVSVIGNYTKIYYGDTEDHSATTRNGSTIRSKWAYWPLYEHDLDDCPYSDSASYSYYSVPLNGDSEICNSETYSTTNISSASYNWNNGTGISISGSGYSITATKTSNGIVSSIQAAITSTYSGTTINTNTKFVVLGIPDYTELDYTTTNSNGNHEIMTCELTSADASYDNQSGVLINIDEYDWDIPNATDWEITEETSQGGIDMRFVEIDYYEDPPPSTEVIKIRAHNSCGWSSWKSITADVDDCGGYYMMMTPNPSSSETTLTILETTQEEAGLKSASMESAFDVNAEWDLEIFDQGQNMKLQKIKLKGSQYTFSTNGWNEGIYFVNVKYKDKLITGKLIVKL